MDRKSIIVLVLSFALLLGWFPLVNYLYPPKPVPTTTAVGTTQGALDRPTAANPAVAPLAPPVPGGTAAKLLVAPGMPERTEVLTTDEARYVFSSHGGGVKVVELLQYPQHVGRKDRGATNLEPATLNTKAPTPILSLLGGPALEGDGVYQLTRTATGLRAEKQLTNGLVVVKDFQPGTNYQWRARLSIENRSGQPVRLPAQTVVFGTATPMTAHDDELTMGLIWYDGKTDTHIDGSWFANRFLGCLPGTPRTEYLEGQSNVVWGAVHNQFFAITAMPKEPAAKLVSLRLELPGPTEAERVADPRAVLKPFGYQTGFQYPETILADGAALVRDYDFFTGPREYHLLARLAASHKNEVDRVMNFSGFWGLFPKTLLLSMNALHGWGLSYGWAIVAITVLIKLIFWPLTHAQTKSMKRMAALAPQLKEMQEKYKDDPQKLGRKQLEFYRDNKVNPFASCLPMLIQIPVFFGFFKMLRTAIELRGAEFFWILDLSQPDTLFYLPGLGWLPFIGVAGHGLPLNPMPLIMGVTMFWQARLTPASPGMDPVQQKIMKYMPLMFLVFLYNFSAGLTLYWTVNNLLTILQTKMTKTDPATEPAPAAAKPASPPARPRRK